MSSVNWLLLVMAILLIISLVMSNVQKRRAVVNGWPVAPRKRVKLTDEPVIAFQKLIRSVQAWGFAELIFGGFALVSSKFMDQWSLLLAVIGAMSFYFSDDPSIFIPYAVILLWAAYRNAVMVSWIVAGIGIVVLIFIGWEYYAFRKVLGPFLGPPSATPSFDPEPDEPKPTIPQTYRARRFFPWLALVLGAVAISGYVITYGFYYLSGSQHSLVPMIDSALAVTLYCALLSVGFSMGALVSKFEPRSAAAIGLSMSLARLLFYALAVLPRLFQNTPGPTT
jgi:hypothetical protein